VIYVKVIASETSVVFWDTVYFCALCFRASLNVRFLTKLKVEPKRYLLLDFSLTRKNVSAVTCSLFFVKWDVKPYLNQPTVTVLRL